MPFSAVLDSSTFNEVHFNPTYENHAKDFFEDLNRDGLLIVDSEHKLQNAIIQQIKSLPTKFRQQLQIRIEEIFKNKRGSVVECYVLSRYTMFGNLLDFSYQLKTMSGANYLIVGNESIANLKSGNDNSGDIVALSQYRNRIVEKSANGSNEKLKSTDHSLKTEMENTIFFSAQFNNRIKSIISGNMFTSREKLLELLAENVQIEILNQEFREFFNDYYVLTSELDEYEKYVLQLIKENEALTHLKHRVLVVEAQRKSSALGREARRMGISLREEPQPKIKVAELSEHEFRMLLRTLGNSRLFTSRGRLLMYMEDRQTTENRARLRAEFCEFFVCYLELELFLENYDYDPDEGLELRPEFVKELEREDEYIQSGGKMFALEEVAKELGVKLECVS